MGGRVLARLSHTTLAPGGPWCPVVALLVARRGLSSDILRDFCLAAQQKAPDHKIGSRKPCDSERSTDAVNKVEIDADDLAVSDFVAAYDTAERYADAVAVVGIIFYELEVLTCTRSRERSARCRNGILIACEGLIFIIKRRCLIDRAR